MIKPSPSMRRWSVAWCARQSDIAVVRDNDNRSISFACSLSRSNIRSTFFGGMRIERLPVWLIRKEH